MTQSVEPVVDKSTNAEGIQELKSQSKPEIFEDGTEKHIPHPLEMQLLNLLENEIVAKGKPEDQIRVIKEIGDLVDLEMPEIDGKKASEMPLDDAKSIREQATNIGNEKPEDVVIPDLRSEYQKKWEKTEAEKQNTVEDWRIEGEGAVAKMGQEIASMRETMREISSHVARYDMFNSTVLMKIMKQPPTVPAGIPDCSTELVGSILTIQGEINSLKTFISTENVGASLQELEDQYQSLMKESVVPEDVELKPAVRNPDGSIKIPAETQRVNRLDCDKKEKDPAFKNHWNAFLEKTQKARADLSLLDRKEKKSEEFEGRPFAKELDAKRGQLVRLQTHLKALSQALVEDNERKFGDEKYLTPDMRSQIDAIINEDKLNEPMSKLKMAILVGVGAVTLAGLYALKHGISEGMKDAGLDAVKNPVPGLTGWQQAALLNRGLSHREVAMIDEEVKERSRKAQEAKGEEESTAEPPTPLAPSPATIAPPTTPSPTAPTPPADAESTA